MTVATHRPLEYPVIPLLGAENAEVLIHPDDLKYGVFLAGGQGCGKTSVLVRLFINSIRDPDAAPIVFDPKPELAPLCLQLTPPGIGKRVWYLDLGHPAFGMNPLRLAGDRPLPVEAAQLAENIVAALLDINENQIFQSSRRYLYHAVIGAIALAESHGRRAKFEDLYNLLLPANETFRAAVAQACADQPDLDQTAEFFAKELTDELQIAGSATAQRLDALAAADNYVAIAFETAVQNPARYTQLVRRAYEPRYQATALRGGRQLRQADPNSVASYAAGARTVATIGARRLDAYSPSHAEVTTWVGAMTWGPNEKPGQTWALVETTLRWDGQRWLVARIDQAARPAPAPVVVGYDDPSARQSSTFSRELRLMTGPTYGGG